MQLFNFMQVRERCRKEAEQRGRDDPQYAGGNQHFNQGETAIACHYRSTITLHTGLRRRKRQKRRRDDEPEHAYSHGVLSPVLPLRLFRSSIICRALGCDGLSRSTSDTSRIAASNSPCFKRTAARLLRAST